jgi:hypothetical protein
MLRRKHSDPHSSEARPLALTGPSRWSPGRRPGKNVGERSKEETGLLSGDRFSDLPSSLIANPWDHTSLPMRLRDKMTQPCPQASARQGAETAVRSHPPLNAANVALEELAQSDTDTKLVGKPRRLTLWLLITF